MTQAKPVYASGTRVEVEKTRSEIEKGLRRHGATHFLYGDEPGRAVVGFVLDGLQVRIYLALPEKGPNADQIARERWRALNLVVKAKLAAVVAGITTIEDEFLSDVILPDGTTVGQWARRQIRLAIEQKRMPPMLPGGKE